MIHNTAEGTQLLRRTLPLEIFLQALALWLGWRLWGSQLHSSEWNYLLLALALANLAKFTHHLLHGLYVDPKVDGYSLASRASLLTINLFIGLSWGFALYLSERHFPGHNSGVAVASFALLAGLVGSALWETAFAVFALGMLLPPFLSVYMSKQWALSAPWIGLLFTSIALLYLARQWQSLFDRYRQTARQNSGLLQELALAKKQIKRDHDDITAAHEKLKQEMEQRSFIEKQIRASEQETMRILQDMQDCYIRVDKTHNIHRVSPSIHFLLGISVSEAKGMKFAKLFSDYARYNIFLNELQRNAGLLQNHETQMLHRGGHLIWVSINAHFSANEPTGSDGFEGSLRDISASKKAEEVLYQEKNRLQVTLESIGDAVITTDNDGKVTYVNPVAETMTGWTSERALNRDLSVVLSLIGEDNRREVKLPLNTWISEGTRGQLNDAVILLSHKVKREYTIELTGSPIRDSQGHGIGYIIVFRNMTKLRALTKQLTHQATHDALTGLINRKEFDQRVSAALHSAKTEKKTHVLCFVDLDKFKIVNDTCGHHAGDLLLQQVTQMLQSKLRSADTLARLGGDEFGVLIVGCNIDHGKAVAESIREAVEQFQFAWENRIFRIGASIGLVSIDSHCQSLEEILSRADAACYAAKEAGRNRVHVLLKDESDIQQQQDQVSLVQRIQRALEFGHFELHAQNVLSLSTAAQHAGFTEILLRLRDETRNNVLLPPDAFISTAERYNLMPQIDQWVVESAFQYLQQHQANNHGHSAYAINISAQSVQEKEFPNWIKDKLKQYHIAPETIIFDLKESAAVENFDVTVNFSRRLSKIGCRFALDHFGSGVGAFSYLGKLKLDMIKIDGELTKSLSNDTGYAVIEAINHICHVMQLTTVAADIEHKKHVELLKKIGVDYAQGSALDKPIPLAQLAQSRAS